MTYLFDFDGTLVDSMPTYASQMLRILEEMLSHEQRATDSGMIAADELREQIEAEREELKLLTRQKNP